MQAGVHLLGFQCITILLEFHGDRSMGKKLHSLQLCPLTISNRKYALPFRKFIS